MSVDKDRFERAPSFQQYLETVTSNRALWTAVYAGVRLPQGLVDAARACGGTLHLVALSEDWCGDAVNTLPVLARFAAEVGWDLRVLSRDGNPDLMDAHLTDGRSRSIPVVIGYDSNFTELGWWGPRPVELQRWVTSEGANLPKEDRYKEVRRWYARDRGQSTIAEVLDVFCDRVP